MLACLVAYVGTLALLAIVGVHLWDKLAAPAALEPSARAGWTAASHASPAFAVRRFDLPGKTETYQIFRHPEGGRKDVSRWSAQGEKSVGELEIYRPGPEFDRSGPASAEMAARMQPQRGRASEAAAAADWVTAAENPFLRGTF